MGAPGKVSGTDLDVAVGASQRTARRLHRALIAIIASAALAAPRPLDAQEATPGTLGVGLSVGVFLDYPEHFAERYCEHGAGGLRGRVAYRVHAALSVRLSAVRSGELGSLTCVTPLRAVPLDGETYLQVEPQEGVRGSSFFATNVTVALDPFPLRRVSPGVHAGVGRLWDKDLGNWLYGGSLRLRLGANAIVVEAERWNVRYDLLRETWIFRESGADELQAVDVLPQSPSPWLFTLGWERSLGG